MINWIKTHKRSVCIMLAIIIGLIVAVPKCNEVAQSRYSEPLTSPKLKEARKPYRDLKVRANVQVEKRVTYKKKNKVLRDSVVKNKVAIDFVITNGEIQITSTDSAGTVSTDHFPVDIKLPEGVDSLKADVTGVELTEKEKTKIGKLLQDMKKGIKKAGKGFAVVGAVAITGVVAVVGAPVVAVVVVGVACGVVLVAVIADKD